MSAKSHDHWIALVELLRQAGIVFSDGLTDVEVERAEAAYSFRFPPDLRTFLQIALPAGDKFPNWRERDDPQVREIMRWPLHGLLFDVEHSSFWLPEWGEKPKLLSEAKNIARNAYSHAPRLIPIYSHRFIPEQPAEAGNPVFSIYQTDIIWYGFDLDDYLRHEFKLAGRAEWPSQVKAIDFWDVERWQEQSWN